jgi:hypothetical protein
VSGWPGAVKALRVRVVQAKSADTPQTMANRMRVPQARSSTS